MQGIIKKVEREIASSKKKLLNRAKKRGLWENFGDKEIRKIEEKYSDYYKYNYVDITSNTIRKMIEVFRDWCYNLEDKDLK